MATTTIAQLQEALSLNDDDLFLVDQNGEGKKVKSSSMRSVFTPEVMTGATSSSPGTSGTVPIPQAGDEDKLLSGSGEWKYLSGIAIGQEVMHYGTTPPPGCLICDGSEVGRATYPELYAVIGTTYGEGDGETTFNLPDRIGRFGQGSLTPGQYIEAGLPNITGSFRTYATDGLLVEGAFSQERIAAGNAASVGANENKYTLSAADSNPIYGKSDTVQPSALTLLPCIKAFDAAVNPGMVNITELANEITGKVDKVVNGKTIAYIVDSYHDDAGNWYRKWSDGWVEQGGKIPKDGSSPGQVTITLLVPLSKILTVNRTNVSTYSSPSCYSNYWFSIEEITGTYLKMSVDQLNADHYWFVAGYEEQA